MKHAIGAVVSFVFPQRVNVLVDWYRVLNASERNDRFKAWGIINDPGCCVPGSDGAREERTCRVRGILAN